MHVFETVLIANAPHLAIVVLGSLSVAFLLFFLVALLRDGKRMRDERGRHPCRFRIALGLPLPLRATWNEATQPLDCYIAQESEGANSLSGHRNPITFGRRSLHVFEVPAKHTERASGKLRWFALGLVLSSGFRLHAQNSGSNVHDDGLREQIQKLTILVQQLEAARISQLEAQQASSTALSSQSPVSPPDPASAHSTSQAPGQSESLTAQATKANDSNIMEFFRDTTVNVGPDGYYNYNFNNPIGRVNSARLRRTQ